jgi:sulfite oxidase
VDEVVATSLKGYLWTEPASNGHWAGVRLRDVLLRVGVQKTAKYVEFIGLDRVERHGEIFGFGGSIDLEKALRGEVLLASELNGAPLPSG